MTIQEALAQHPGHWWGADRVAALNDAGDLLLITRFGGSPSKVRRVTGGHEKKVTALHEFMGVRRRGVAA